jgi:dienelactone hydrolase
MGLVQLVARGRRLLASRGRAAMAVAYFDWGEREGLCGALSEVPLEHFETATNLLRRAEVDPTDLAVVGISKGAEAALLLAARRPDIARVVALSASSHAWESVRLDPEAEASSWSARGEPVPYLRFDVGDEFYRTLDKRLLLPCHEAALDAEAEPAAAIPVELIRADTLLISLSGDVVWPSRRMADAVAARMTEAGAAPVRHVVLEAAGHALFAPGTPANGVDGDPAAAARADYLAWQATLQHLGLPYRLGTVRGRRAVRR